MAKPFFAAALCFLCVFAYAQQSDALLRSVINKDQAGKLASGKLTKLSAAEHLSRGQTYFENRLFPEAREHFQKIFDNYPTDPAMSGALFMTGRSYYWERSYDRAIPFLARVAREYPNTKDGREGLSFHGACLVRLGRNAEAAKVYEQYTVMFPNGERVEGAYLNTIDALREARDYSGAESWVDKAAQRFAGMPAHSNALHARLRMAIFRGEFAEAVKTADELLLLNDFGGSMTSSDEVKYLKALALERSGRGAQSVGILSSIPNSSTSYYAGLATDKLNSKGKLVRATASVSGKAVSEHPAAFRADVLREATARDIDPRFVLAIMKQESGFRPGVKSPSAARGLLQLVIDTAMKYNQKAGFPNLQPDDLYDARTNIAIGCEYIADLKREFGGLYEAIAASYNGGEDNAGRWLARSNPRDPGVFASEVGFAETKHYVFKVMTNYRNYKALYDENLNRR